MSWLISKALMNSLCLPEQVEEYLGENSLDGEQSVQSSGNPIQLAYCAPDKMTAFSRLSRFGMMFKPLMDIPGEELSMSSVVAFHVRTFQQQEKAQELMESEAECGDKWCASFTKYDPDSCSWKTHQCSLLGGLDEFSETWPQWGLMRDGECWEQQMLEQNISETEFGLWPTPTTPTGGGNFGGSGAYKNAIKNGTHIPHSINPNLYEWLMGWPLGWTDLKPLEMGRFPCARLLPGESYQEINDGNN
jgi:hypothetical protein